MRGVLDKIVQAKLEEVATLKSINSLASLKKNSQLKETSRSLKTSILKGSGVIAEFKRASPSKGQIRTNADPKEIALGYELAGASAISVLTDNTFFQGSVDDLIQVKQTVELPVLRKDFTIDPYQIYEAKIMGADCILLIAAILSKQQIADYLSIAYDLGLEAIIEIHDSVELEKLSGKEEIVGVNNRNLDTFEVDISNSIMLSEKLNSQVKIAESGLDSGSNLSALQKAGFNGFLVGESFMKEEDPGAACHNFIKNIKEE